MLLYIQKDDDFKSREARARAILGLYKSSLKARSTARAVNPAAPSSRKMYTKGAGEPRPLADWRKDVKDALIHGAGVNGTIVLVTRLTAQQKSQACGTRAIAAKLRMAESDVEFIYRVALNGFLHWMDHHHIPDDYREEAEMPVVSQSQSPAAVAKRRQRAA